MALIGSKVRFAFVFGYEVEAVPWSPPQMLTHVLAVDDDCLPARTGD